MDEFARSVARQWQRHEGHACLFVGGHQQLVLKLNEHGDGTCDVVTRRVAVDLGAALSSFGFPPEVLPQLIAGINLNQEIDFRDRQGVRCRLRFDPKAGRIDVRPVDLVPPQTPPVLCPKCTAVLRPWQEGERQQTCPHCGQTVSLPGQPAVAPRDAAGPVPALHGGPEALAGGGAATDLPPLRPDHLAWLTAPLQGDGQGNAAHSSHSGFP